MIVEARTVVPAVSGAVAVGVLLGAPNLLAPASIGSWLLLVPLLAAALLLSKFRTFLATVAFTVAVGAVLLTSAAVHSAARHPELLVEAADAGRYVTAIAVVDADVGTGAQVVARTTAGPSASGQRVPVTLTDVTVAGKSVQGLAIPALLFSDLEHARVGTRVSVGGELRSTQAGDRFAYLFFTRSAPRVIEPPPWYLSWAGELRSGFRAAAVTLPGDGGALLPGLALGDTGAVSATLDAAMKSTSLSHLTAVSGANCAVVVALIMLLGRAFGASRRVRVIASLVVLAGFVVLVTPDASVLRAAVMAALVLFSLASGRPSRGLPVLSLAIMVLLCVDPWLSRDYGFILSVLATAGLLVLAGPLAAVLSRWLPDALAVLVSIPLAAQLACQPVLILLHPSIPVYGVVANILAEPAAPIATVLGLLACVCLPLLPPLGTVLLVVAWLPSSWIAGVARFFASAPAAQAPWIPGAIGVIVLATLTVAVLLVLLRRPSRSTKIVLVALFLSAACYGGVTLGTVLGRTASQPSAWQFAVCDVGQGDAILVRSAGRVALIDTGPKPEALAACLDRLGIHRIQLLILSHYDLDHVDGTSAVLGMVDTALVGPAADAGDRQLRSSLSRAGAVVTEVSRGARGLLGELRWEVLWPPSRVGAVTPGNDASVTVRFEGVGQCRSGCLSALFLGDLGEESQSRMYAAAHPAPVDVVKVAHHGSADQSPRLYERVRARLGLISVGAQNTYGHPSDRLLHLLTEAGTEIVRTDLEGMVLVGPAPEGEIEVWTERAPERDVGAH